MPRHQPDGAFEPVALSQSPDLPRAQVQSCTIPFARTAGRIVGIGPGLPATSRILLIGRRAQHAACRPVVDLMRMGLTASL
jgi:hypothetical protein